MQKLIQKSHNNCVLEDSYKNPFDRKSPATCGSSLRSSRQVGVPFCLRIFHRFCLFTISRAILSELCVCDIVSCFVLSKWVDGLYEIWAKCQRHLWAGFVSFLSTDFSSRASSQVVARHSKNILNL